MNTIIDKKIEVAVNRVTNEFENKVITLEKQVHHLKSVLNNDSTHSGIPTSQTTINKKKKLLDSRAKSNRKRDGHPGHTKRSLKRFEVNEIDVKSIIYQWVILYAYQLL